MNEPTPIGSGIPPVPQENVYTPPNSVLQPVHGLQPASPQDRTMGMVAHLSALSGCIIPFGNIIGPLIVWLTQKDKSPWVDYQAKESLNFQITATIALLICAVLMIVLIGLLLMPLVGIATLVLTIIGSIKANEGVAYRYPFTLRLIK